MLYKFKSVFRNFIGSRIEKVFLIFHPYNPSHKTTSFNYNFLRINEPDCCSSQKMNIHNLFYETNNSHFISKDELGRATWKILNAISFNYPNYPTLEYKNKMASFLKLFAHFYPCDDCKTEFISYLQVNPPHLVSRNSFIKWVCTFHNVINQKLGKNIIDCSDILNK